MRYRSRTFAWGGQPNHPQHFGCQCSLAFKLTFAKCSELPPCPSTGSGGTEPGAYWGKGHPPGQLCPPAQQGALRGISPSPPGHAPGLPAKGWRDASHGWGTGGAFFAYLPEKARKLVCKSSTRAVQVADVYRGFLRGAHFLKICPYAC